MIDKSPNEIADEWLEDLKTVPVERQPEWVKYTLESKKMLHVFGRFFFPHIIKGNGTPDCHIELIRELTKPKDSAIIFPRGFSKSTWVKIDTIHDIVYGIEPVIVYVSDTLQDAGFHFESMKSELENNSDLRAVFGNLVPDMASRETVKWTNTHFETTNGINVVARGANKGRGVNIKNNRPTKIIIDDAETDEQVSSAIRRIKYHDWLYNVIIPSLDKKRGRIKCIGTVIHKECEVLKFYNAKGGIYRQAIEEGKSIWPEYWPITDLERLRDGYYNDDGKFIEGIGTRSFNQEYMNNPSSFEDATINPTWIDEHFYTTLPKSTEKLNKVIAYDPQSGEKGLADEYAITVLAWYTGDRHRYVLDQKAGRGSQLQQVTEVIKMWMEHRDAKVVGVEKVLNQVAGYQLLIDWRNRLLEIDGLNIDDRNIPVKAINPGGKDKVTRLQKHEPMIERGELHLRPEMKKLREQILFIGTNILEHDDRVDCLTMALDLSMQSTSTKQSIQSMAMKSPTALGTLAREKF